MERNEQPERDTQAVTRKRQALRVRTGVRAGAEEVSPAPTTVAPAAPALPAAPTEVAKTITIKVDDLVKLLQGFGGSA